MTDPHPPLDALLAAVLPTNPFYARKLAGWSPGTPLESLPFTTKAELVADQADHPPYGSNLTYPVAHYTRLHQTSGTTTGRPLRWLDTPESWAWCLGCWEATYALAGVRPGDRLVFPFSFGPFLGFWTAFEAAGRCGLLAIPGGGLSSTARLKMIADHAATVVLCTPTYALHLAEVAAAEGIDLAASSVRAVIVAGEPGGGIPATRARIEAAWGARLFDHAGLTEVGPTASEAVDDPGNLHVLPGRYLAECIDPTTLHPVPAGEEGELVLTNLGRVGSPLIRYRTGDRVRLVGSRLVGGILGRTDDMIHVRGNNLYPSALEAVVRRFADVAEYRVAVGGVGELTRVRVEIEPVPSAAAGPLVAKIDRAIRDDLLFRAEVAAVAPGSLPRFELKARRIVRLPEGASPP